jgi:hypothetical protein
MPLLLLALVGCPYVSTADFDGRFDLDGDGVARPDDCDDGDASIGILEYHLDADRDGFGHPTHMVVACTPAAGAVEDATDCNDRIAGVNPDGVERCNNLDDDCDGVIDGESAVDVRWWFPDVDQDGFGDRGSTGVASCEQQGTYADNNDDCDDTSALIRDFQWFEDLDRDGFGNPAQGILRCEAPAGFVADGTDCDDADATVHPGAPEVCDAADKDEDCSGEGDDDVAEGRPWWFRDADADGWGDIHDRLQGCNQPSGYVEDDSDCDDTSPDTLPQIDCPYTQVAAGDSAFCAVQSNGRLSCVGADWVTADTPVGGFVSVSVGRTHACAVTVSGELQCWGWNDAVLVGLEGVDEVLSDVSIDGSHTCAIDDDGAVRCWGDGIAYTVDRGEPFSSVETGAAHACAMYDGTGDPAEGFLVDCFGSCGGDGECDDPVGRFDQIAAGDGFSCGLTTIDQSLHCWGGVSMELPPTFGVAHLSAYGDRACVLTDTGRLVCWGRGVSVTPDASGYTYAALDVGSYVACMIDLDGDVSCIAED